MPFEKTIEIKGLDHLAAFTLDSAKVELRMILEENLKIIFDSNKEAFNTDSDFPLDGINLYVHTNNLKLRHIASELISNSMDALLSFRHDRSKSHKIIPIITITLKESGDDIEIIVSDNGPGFSEKFIEDLRSNLVVSTKSVTDSLMGGAGAGVKQLIGTAQRVGLRYDFSNNLEGGAHVSLSIGKETLLTPKAYVQQKQENIEKKKALFGANPTYKTLDGKFIPFVPLKMKPDDVSDDDEEDQLSTMMKQQEMKEAIFKKRSASTKENKDVQP